MIDEYYKERTGFSTIENPYGFIVYKVDGENCYISELFVKPAHRISYIATKLADEVEDIAKASGCKKIWGQVVPSTGGSSVALMAHLKWGLKLHSSEKDCIITMKEI